MYKIRNILILTLFFKGFYFYSQGIINTESMLNQLSNGFNLSTSLEGDFKSGNVNLNEISSTSQLSFTKSSTLIRLITSYDFIEENNEILSNDFTSHIRINSYNMHGSSFFAFFQFQKAVSISLKRRFLIGTGYRYRLFNKKSNYFDLAPGIFFENEEYYFNKLITVQNNFRVSLNNFMNFTISDQLSLSSVTYFQISSKNIEDFRLFVEPKLNLSLKKFNFYYRYLFKYHSTPYINIFSKDVNGRFGVEYKF